MKTKIDFPGNGMAPKELEDYLDVPLHFTNISKMTATYKSCDYSVTVVIHITPSTELQEVTNITCLLHSRVDVYLKEPLC